MRITCPNCNAQYEVGDDMIPSEGRDVQCSNCGTTWFQEGRPRAATAVEARAVRRPGRKEPKVDETAQDAATEASGDDTPDDQTEVAPVFPSRHRRPTIDDETLDVLRKEREREDSLRTDTRASAPVASDEPAAEPDPREQAAAERARMAAAATLARARDADVAPSLEDDFDDENFDDENDPDPAPPPPEDDDVSNAIAATLRDASATEDEAEDETPFPVARSGAVPSEAKSARRELLPDIEEINSSLRPDERAAEAEAEANGGVDDSPAEMRRSSGFRIGFLVIAASIAIAVGVYVFAGPIAEMVPQAGAALARYVAWVDAQRIALAAAAEALTARITPES